MRSPSRVFAAFLLGGASGACSEAECPTTEEAATDAADSGDVDADSDTDTDSDADVDTGSSGDRYEGFQESDEAACGRVTGEQVEDVAGGQVQRGDWNGDGQAGLAILAEGWDGRHGDAPEDPHDIETGVVWLVDGGGPLAPGEVHDAGSLSVAWIVSDPGSLGPIAQAWLSVPGDLDGDGADDLLLGWYADSEAGPGAGAVTLYRSPHVGERTVSDWDAKILGGGPYESASLPSPAGDLDGDGVPDFLVSAAGLYTSDLRAGYAVSGNVPDGTSSMDDSLARFQGEQMEDAYCGYELTGPGDLDGDGIGDVVAGAPCGSQVDWWEGALWVLLGPIAGDMALADAEALWTGTDDGDGATETLAPGGDIDGDGLDDVLVGAQAAPWGEGYECDVGYPSGRVWILSGPATGGGYLDEGTAVIEGEPCEGTGLYVAGGEDLDRDGYDEVVSQGFGSNIYPGTVRLFYGPLSGTYLTTTADATWQDMEERTWAVLLASDVNGDVLPDLVLGVPGASNARGEVRIFPGVPVGR